MRICRNIELLTLQQGKQKLLQFHVISLLAVVVR